jgi:hypothetical protein
MACGFWQCVAKLWIRLGSNLFRVRIKLVRVEEQTADQVGFEFVQGKEVSTQGCFGGGLPGWGAPIAPSRGSAFYLAQTQLHPPP